MKNCKECIHYKEYNIMEDNISYCNYVNEFIGNRFDKCNEFKFASTATNMKDETENDLKTNNDIVITIEENYRKDLVSWIRKGLYDSIWDKDVDTIDYWIKLIRKLEGR